MYCHYPRNQTFKYDSIYFVELQYWEIERTRRMTDQEDFFSLGKIVFDDSNQETKSWDCLGQTCCRCLIVFLSPTYFGFVDYL